jgi:hypothetical protein
MCSRTRRQNQSMVSLEPICLARNVKIDPGKADDAVQTDIPALEDLGRLFEMLEITEEMKKKITEVSFSEEVRTIFEYFSAAAEEVDPFIKGIETIDSVIKAIDSRDEETRKKLAEDREKFARMLMQVEIAQQKFAASKQGLSAQCLANFEQLLSAEETPSATFRFIKALRNTILATSLKLSPAAKKKLGIGKPNWIEKLTRNDIERVLTESCQRMKYEEKPRKPVVGPQPVIVKPDEDISLNFRVNLGAGYMFGPALSGSDDLPLLAGTNQGPFSRGGVSLGYPVSGNLSVYGGVSGRLVMADNVQESKEGTDRANARLDYRPAQIFETYIQGEWLRHSNTTLNPEEEERNPDLETVGSEVGMALRLGDVQPFLCGVGGYELIEGKPVYGGCGGASWQGFRLRADYVMDIFTGTLDYIYNADSWGLGPSVVYRLREGESEIGAGVEGTYSLGKVLENDLALRIFLNSSYAGIGIGFGGLGPAEPSVLERVVDPFGRRM